MMKLFITGAGTPLADAAIARLSPSHSVCAASYPGATGAADAARLALRDFDAVAAAVEGVDTVLHLAPFAPECFPGETEAERLDAASRGTYELMSAAREAGVRRTIVAGRLSMFDSYDERWLIDESWRPRPQPVLDELAPYLCEVTCREFAREAGEVICLRFGDLAEVSALAAAVEAIEKALSAAIRPGFRYALAHISDSPRFESSGAERLFHPEHRERGRRRRSGAS